MNEEFVARLITYSLQLKQEYGRLPKVLITTIKSITAKVKSKFKNLENEYMHTMNCDLWAESCQIISAKSIQTQLNNNPLNKLVALGHFLIQQKRNILSIGRKHDPTIQLLYQISEDKFENECYVEEEKLVVIKDLCFKAKTQFEKIVKCLQKERKFNKNRETTPIEDTPDISNLITVSYNNDIAMDERSFTEEFKIKQGRMSWERCYDEGRNRGFFLN
ncbi:hypothetical protein CU098_005426, partial [Rhizopus stolonifer]